ncbi:hypothetical protein [Methylocystis sp.]
MRRQLLGELFALRRRAMTALTEVELYYLKNKIERWIRFGAP